MKEVFEGIGLIEAILFLFRHASPYLIGQDVLF